MRSGSFNFSSKRILLIENNKMMRKLVREVLIGFGVHTSNIVENDNVNDAIQHVYASRFDLVITDFFLGTLDGGDFTRHIRGDEACPNRKIPILLITGAPNHEKVLKALESGVDEMLAKPISPQSLYFRLVSMLTRQRPFVMTSAYVGPSRGVQRQESMAQLMRNVQSSDKRKWRKVEAQVLRFKEHSKRANAVDRSLFS